MISAGSAQPLPPGCPDSTCHSSAVFFYGALRFGRPSQRRKRFLLLDTEPYQYQKTMSDAAGLDPRAHDDEPEKLIACVRDFLSTGLDPKPIGALAARLGLTTECRKC